MESLWNRKAPIAASFCLHPPELGERVRTIKPSINNTLKDRITLDIIGRMV